LKGIVPLAKVDCTASSSVCGKYGVSGYPTLKIFRDGEDSGSYDGPRTADGIVSHLKKQAGPSSVELKSEAEFQKFIGDRDASVVGFFADGGSAAQGEFLKAASALRESYRFAYTNVEDLLKKHDVDGEGIILFRPPHLGNKFEDGSVKFTEDKFTSAKIKKFIQDNIFGICPHMNDDNKDQLKGKDLLVAYYDVDYEKNPKGSNYWRNRFYLCVHTKKISQKKNQSLFVCSRDGKALEKFLQDYFDGNLKRYLKSETIPENNDGPVKVVVAENFDSIVNDESKDVLIEFYAPWCGHCKSLEPKFKELGEKLSDDPNIVIAKMDATANDVPSSYEVRGFPTIYFSPAGQKQNPKKYEGGREVSDFISYLKREATNTVVVQEDEKKSKKKKSEL
uniref:protein disulfide-isomerase n=1 Tax=Sinocyclocheilus grahami TaxID=75366 RepID=A0A672PGB0_SINGR